MRLCAWVLVTCAACKGFFDPRPDCGSAIDTPRALVQFIQASDNSNASGTSMTVAFPVAQRAGNTIVALVAADQPVNSVRDKAGNAYVQAAAPQGGVLSAYVAANIAAAASGGNSVTVSWSQLGFISVRILEYGGLDPALPVDSFSWATSTSATTDAGPLVTTHAHDLIVATESGPQAASGPGPGFTQRLITVDSDIVEDEEVFAIGTYHATAQVTTSATYESLAVALRAAD